MYCNNNDTPELIKFSMVEAEYLLFINIGVTTAGNIHIYGQFYDIWYVTVPNEADFK